jgi:hypothetical protein
MFVAALAGENLIGAGNVKDDFASCLDEQELLWWLRWWQRSSVSPGLHNSAAIVRFVFYVVAALSGLSCCSPCLRKQATRGKGDIILWRSEIEVGGPAQRLKAGAGPLHYGCRLGALTN